MAFCRVVLARAKDQPALSHLTLEDHFWKQRQICPAGPKRVRELLNQADIIGANAALLSHGVMEDLDQDNDHVQHVS